MTQTAPTADSIALTLAQLDTHGIAACHIDADERMQSWNQSYLRFFPEHLGIVHVGWSYLDNLRHYFTVNHGASVTGERLEAMVAAAVERHHAQIGAMDFQKLDGRWLRSQVNRFADGGLIKTWADVTAEVLHSESSVIEALSTLQQALLCYDLSGRFIFANNRASSFFPGLINRFQPDSSFADHLTHLADEAMAGADRDILLRLAVRDWPAAPGQSPQILINMKHDRVVQLELTPTRDGGLTVVWTDMTEAHRLLAERSRAEAEATAKSEFLAVMSHEIRTPLNGVLGSIGLLDRTMLTARDRELLDTAHGSAEHLLHLLNDILDFSKLEAGRVELEDVDFDLRRLGEGVVSSLRSRAETKGLRLDWRFDPALPPVLRGDPGRLRQILFNLIGNAIKFTETGWVRLDIGFHDMAGGGRGLELLVADSGIGIAPEIRPQLFRHFTQGDSSITRRYGGTGLGLAICGQLAALMQGSIVVDSVPGQGSEFRLHLPLRLGVAGLLPAMPLAQPRLEGILNILVAEDNPTNQMILGTMLKQLGHKAAMAANGREACAMLSQGHYDIVLMDMQMPEMDGIAASRAIRAMAEPLASTPIVAITANALAGDRERCLAAGMNGYVTKPIDVGALVVSMEQALNTRLPRKPIPQPAAQPNEELAQSAAKALGALAQRLKQQASAT